MRKALYQRDEHGLLQPMFKSKAFNEAQKRLAVHDREGFGVIVCNEIRHHLLMRKFEVQMHHSALGKISASKDLLDLYARWYHKLAEFEGTSIKHRAGRKLYCADALPRRRQVKGDDARPFWVEPGVLYTLTCDQEVSAGGLHAHTYTHTLAQDSIHTHACRHNTHTHTHTLAPCTKTPARTRTRPYTKMKAPQKKPPLSTRTALGARRCCTNQATNLSPRWRARGVSTACKNLSKFAGFQALMHASTI